MNPQPERIVVAPVPIDLPRASILRTGARLGRMSALGARYFVPVAGRTLLRRDARAPHAARLLFERLGATYIKFGQFIASAPGLVGEEVAAEFRGCLDTGPSIPFDYVRTAVEDAIGGPLSSAFSDFAEEPVAAASIAVVHRARLLDGSDVAVKVLRPGIERTVAADLAVLERWVRFIAARGVDHGYDLVGLIVGLRMTIAEELDLRNEARTMDTFRGLFDRFGLSLLVVPRVHPQHSSSRVLVMEFLEGSSIDDFAHAEAAGIDPRPLVRELLKAWVLTGLRVGAFHADIHAGNLVLMPDGRLGMLDWGIVARMEDESYRLFRALCEASLGREEAWDVIGTMVLELNGPGLSALGLTEPQIRHFARELFEPVLTHPLSQVSMADMMMSGDEVILKATGEAPSRRSLRDRWRSMRTAARAYRQAAANRVFEHPTQRMGFLSMKQLIYLEHYGRMYIPDESLLGDGDFVRRALEGDPVAT
ncbi:MAG: AarF/ABC1/UbiB kinase family protein [Dehalococcoidia bacterium]